MFGRLGKLVRDVRGATAIEYGLIISLIVIAVVGGVSALGSSSSLSWGSMTNKVAAVTPAA